MDACVYSLKLSYFFFGNKAQNKDLSISTKDLKVFIWCFCNLHYFLIIFLYLYYIDLHITFSNLLFVLKISLFLRFLVNNLLICKFVLFTDMFLLNLMEK